MGLECLEGGGLVNVFPPSPFLWDPLRALPVFPAQPQPPPGERAEQEGPDSQPDRSSVEGALSQNCTQCTERILFLGFWVREEEEEGRWRRRRSRRCAACVCTGSAGAYPVTTVVAPE
ncbi:hypothetical protein EYF80_007097 [Liparis tanakae]|uniref:Uncharacterized protein n=1 Tax=Liparis tanakae TaxID=230148 RepID=A0A4Z2IX61_9TELE|nr:hypothetical protein EYF80_007097 [Liparis tanakae]